ncbi:MAG TPA: hypothetical protein VF865_21285 [Acidobacteriaceae bacterium]
MNLQMFWVIHILPLWFLVFALFLPRIALLVLWLETSLVPFDVHGFLGLVLAILLPRVLVLYLVYVDQGISLWFVLHLAVALLVWGGSGRYSTRRRRDRYHEIG